MQEEKLIQAIHELVETQKQMTTAIAQLVEVNMRMIDSFIMDDEPDDGGVNVYLDGTKVNG